MASCHSDKGGKILIQIWSLFLSIPDRERMLEIDFPLQYHGEAETFDSNSGMSLLA